MQLSAAERRVAEHFTSAHPHVPVVEVPAQPDDVHDLAGLGRWETVFLYRMTSTPDDFCTG